MRILVTGAAGLIGSHAAIRFLDRGHEVFAIDNLSGGYRDNVDPRAVFVQSDCCNRGEMMAVMQLARPEVIVHCAASPHEGLSVFSPHYITRSVFDATVCVMSAAASIGVRRFCNTSSMARYGAAQKPPFVEDGPALPVDPYGIAKLAAENAVHLLGKVHGVEVTTVIPHNVLGKHQRYDDMYRNVVAIFINRLLQNKPAIIYGNGEQTRCFSFVQDAIDCIEKLTWMDDVDGMIVNIGPDDKDVGHLVTINELYEKVQDVCRIYVDPIYVPDRPQEVKHAFCSSEKARKLLGYKTSVSLEDGIGQMVEWIKRRGPMPFSYHLPIEIQNDKTPRTWIDRMF